MVPDTGSVGVTTTPGGVGMAIEVGMAVFEDGMVTVEGVVTICQCTIGVAFIANGNGTEDIPTDEVSATLVAGGESNG